MGMHLQLKYKKHTFLYFWAFISCFFSSCNNNSDYPLELLYGRWEVSRFKVENAWFEAYNSPVSIDYSMTLIFYDDGTCYAADKRKHLNGIYKVKDKTITIYRDGVKYLSYTINSLTDKSADFNLISIGIGGEKNSDTQLIYEKR